MFTIKEEEEEEEEGECVKEDYVGRDLLNDTHNNCITDQKHHCSTEIYQSSYMPTISVDKLRHDHHINNRNLLNRLNTLNNTLIIKNDNMGEMIIEKEEMDSIKEKDCKRLIDSNYSRTDEEISDANQVLYMTFFEDFNIPIDRWFIMDKIEEMGLLLMHKETRKPLIIVNTLNPESNAKNGYSIKFRFDEDIKANRWQDAYISMKYDDEEHNITMLHALDQIHCKFISDGILETVNEEKHYSDFLSLFGMSKIPNNNKCSNIDDNPTIRRKVTTKKNDKK